MKPGSIKVYKAPVDQLSSYTKLDTSELEKTLGSVTVTAHQAAVLQSASREANGGFCKKEPVKIGIAIKKKVEKLVTKLKTAEEEDKKHKEKLWKTRRSILWEIELLGGWQALEYNSFKDFCKHELPKHHLSAYFSERMSARYENLLGLPICSYGMYVLFPLNAIEVYQTIPGNQYRKPQEVEPTRRKIDLLRMAWRRSLEIANDRDLTQKFVYKAVEELHHRYPDEIRYPGCHNTGARNLQRIRELEAENADLKKSNADLETEVAKLKALLGKYVCNG
jgi:hypothetical protein